MANGHCVAETFDRSVLLSMLRTLGTRDCSVRLPIDMGSLDGEIALALNSAVDMIERRFTHIEQARAALEEKAEQLARISLQKSEFIAGLSQELRTSLNGLLAVAEQLIDDTEQPLTPAQLAYAGIIRSVGSDLLSFINATLELARIQSGGTSLKIEVLKYSELRAYVEQKFRPLAETKVLTFSVEIAADLPEVIHTDARLLGQIVTNLLSNAFKFTQRGKVVLRVAPANSWASRYSRLNTMDKVVAFTVMDSGIGIAEDRLKTIFDPFQPGTTSRKSGGSGLSLSISRELAHLLGGEIYVSSTSGRGSTFALYLPLIPALGTIEEKALSSQTPAEDNTSATVSNEPRSGRNYAWPQVFSESQHTPPEQRTVLIIENDSSLSDALLDMVHDNGFRGVVASDAVTALGLVRELVPDAIILNMHLPDSDGWAVLSRLKQDEVTRHISVSLISVADGMHKCLQVGPFGLARNRPAEKDTIEEAIEKIGNFVESDFKRVLVADQDSARRDRIVDALRAFGLDVVVSGTADQVIASLRNDQLDCLVLGPSLSDMTSSHLIRKLIEFETRIDMPFVFYESEPVGDNCSARHEITAEVAVLKSLSSPEELIWDTTLFLHRALSNLPRLNVRFAASKKNTPELAGLKILIIDDDIRNIFSLTGALEQHRMIVFHAENGKEGVEMLKSNPDMNFVLVDTMMPWLNGYDTIRIIRGIEAFQRIPIIALTAESMPDDREKCLDAGSSDYLAKPVNIEQLLSLLRVWFVN